MEVKNLFNAQKVPFDLEGWSLIKSDKAELVYLKLKPGEYLEKHKNPFDVIFYILKGEGKLLLENEVKILQANDSIFIGSNLDRGWKNDSNEELNLLVFKIMN